MTIARSGTAARWSRAAPAARRFGDARLQPRDRHREERPLALGRAATLRREERDVRARAVRRPAAARRRSCNSRRPSSSIVRAPTDRRRTGGPVRVRQHRQPIPLRIVGRIEQAAEMRLLPEQWKVRARDRFRRDPLRDRPVRDRDQAALVRGHRAEGRMVRFERAVVDDGEAEFVWADCRCRSRRASLDRRTATDSRARAHTTPIMAAVAPRPTPTVRTIVADSTGTRARLRIAVAHVVRRDAAWLSIREGPLEGGRA